MNAQLPHKFLIATAVVALAALTGCDSRTAEEKGKALATEKLDVATGIGSALEEKGSKAGESLVTGLGNVVKGFEKGVNKSGRTLVSEESVTKAGLQITKVQDAVAAADEKPAIEVYILSQADAEGKLRVIMQDVMDKEIGRASIQLSRKADDGKYQRIEVDPQLDRSAISKLVFSFTPGAVLTAGK